MREGKPGADTEEKERSGWGETATYPTFGRHYGRGGDSGDSKPGLTASVALFRSVRIFFFSYFAASLVVSGSVEKYRTRVSRIRSDGDDDKLSCTRETYAYGEHV